MHPIFRLPSYKSFATQKMKPPKISCRRGSHYLKFHHHLPLTGAGGGGGGLWGLYPPPPPVALLTLLTFDPLSSLHSPPHCGAVASSKLQSKMFPLDQQSQNKAIPGCLPCTIWTSTSLLDWTDALFRCTMLLVFAFNTHADPSLNLLVIGTAVIGLLTLTHFTGLMYKMLYLDILEISFIVNLGILAVATYYVKLAVVPVSQAAVAYTSVGIAFAITFIGVLLYHAYQQVWLELQQKICVTLSRGR